MIYVVSDRSIETLSLRAEPASREIVKSRSQGSWA